MPLPRCESLAVRRSRRAEGRRRDGGRLECGPPVLGGPIADKLEQLLPTYRCGVGHRARTRAASRRLANRTPVAVVLVEADLRSADACGVTSSGLRRGLVGSSARAIRAYEWSERVTADGQAAGRSSAAIQPITSGYWVGSRRRDMLAKGFAAVFYGPFVKEEPAATDRAAAGPASLSRADRAGSPRRGPSQARRRGCPSSFAAR